MSVVLTRIRRILARNLVAILLLDEGSSASRHSLADGSLRLVLTRSGVLVGHKLVLVSEVHIIHFGTDRQ